MPLIKDCSKDDGEVKFEGTFAEKKEEAAKTLRGAEEYLAQELDLAECGRLSDKALALYQELDDPVGIADAMRMVCHVFRYNDRRKEAVALVAAEMQRFAEKGDVLGEAKMLCSLAELNGVKRGAKNRELAIDYGRRARAVFHQHGEKRLECLALVALVNAQLKKLERQGDVRESAEETLENAILAHGLAEYVGDKKLQAVALHGLTVGRVICKEFDLAFKSCQDAISIYSELGLRKCEAMELQSMASWYLEADKPGDALPVARKAVAIFADLGIEAAFRASAVQIACHALSRQGLHKDATALARSERVRFRHARDHDSEGAMAEALVQAHWSAGEPEEALVACEEAAMLYRKLKNERREADVLQMTARVQLGQKRLFRAMQAAQRALAILVRLGDEREQAAVHEVLGDIHLAQEHYDKALGSAVKERTIFKSRSERNGEGVALLHMCNALIQKGDIDEAMKFADEAVELFTEAGDMERSAHTLSVLSEVQFQREDYEKSLRSAKQAKTLCRQAGKVAHETALAVSIVRIHLILLANSQRSSKESQDSVARTANESLALCRKLGNPMLLASALNSAAQVYLILGRVAEAQAAVDEALPILEASSDTVNVGYALILSGQAHFMGRRIEKAKEKLESAMDVFTRIDEQKGLASAQLVMDQVHQFEKPTDVVPQGGSEVAAVDNSNLLQQRLDTELVRMQVMQVTKQIIGNSDDIHEDSPLLNVGLTSMSSAMLRDSLAREFPDVNLPFTLAFDYPSVNSIADFLAESTMVPLS